MATKRVKKQTPSPNLINDIYTRFQAKATEISAKNFQAFESAFKKIDYLEINYLLHHLSQMKVLR